jgi:hypothetical protein
MIGDHLQLRPAYNDYETARQYKINISLFERLIRLKFPYRTLQYQHRMRRSGISAASSNRIIFGETLLRISISRAALEVVHAIILALCNIFISATCWTFL